MGVKFADMGQGEVAVATQIYAQASSGHGVDRWPVKRLGNRFPFSLDRFQAKPV
jgi:hypothetical protein